MPAKTPAVNPFRHKPRKSIAVQAIIELQFRVDCLYSVASEGSIKALLQAVKRDPWHDHTAAIDRLLEFCCEAFDRVNP